MLLFLLVFLSNNFIEDIIPDATVEQANMNNRAEKPSENPRQENSKTSPKPKNGMRIKDIKNANILSLNGTSKQKKTKAQRKIIEFSIFNVLMSVTDMRNSAANIIIVPNSSII